MKKTALARTLASALLLFLSLGVFAQGIDNIMLEAVGKYQAGEFKSAKDQLQTLSQAAPGNDAVWYYLALCEVELGETASAITHMAKAASIDPDNYWYRQRLALLYSATGNIAKQIEMFEALKRDFPQKAYSISYDLVNLYIEAKRYDDALAALDDVESATGVDIQTLRVRYDILRNSGRDDDAALLLEEYCKEQPSAFFLAMLGDLHMDYDRYDQALECYSAALELEPDYVPALLGKSEVYRVTKQMDQYFSAMGEFMSSPGVEASSKSMYITNAVKSLDPRTLKQMQSGFDTLVNLAVEAHPTDSTMLQTAGIYYYSTERVDEAKQYLRRNADLHPDSILLEGTYLELLGYTGDWAELRSRSEAAFKRFGKWEFLEYAASAAFQEEDWQGVLDYSLAKINHADGDTLAIVSGWTSVGDMYYAMGKSRKAYKAYAKALKLDPDYVLALNNYAYYLAINGGCLKKAAKMAAHAVELAPTEATYLDTYGWILHLQKKDAEARPIFQKVMGYGGKDSAVLLDHYAEVLFSLGEYSLAREYWKEALAKNNGHIPDLEERVAKREKVMSGGR